MAIKKCPYCGKKGLYLRKWVGEYGRKMSMPKCRYCGRSDTANKKDHGEDARRVGSKW